MCSNRYSLSIYTQEYKINTRLLMCRLNKAIGKASRLLWSCFLRGSSSLRRNLLRMCCFGGRLGLMGWICCILCSKSSCIGIINRDLNIFSISTLLCQRSGHLDSFLTRHIVLGNKSSTCKLDNKFN
jgi:hypothetical protein